MAGTSVGEAVGNGTGVKVGKGVKVAGGGGVGVGGAAKVVQEARNKRMKRTGIKRWMTGACFRMGVILSH
jgi:hypothetical protein